jgi:hypothetical protein
MSNKNSSQIFSDLISLKRKQRPEEIPSTHSCGIPNPYNLSLMTLQDRKS